MPVSQVLKHCWVDPAPGHLVQVVKSGQAWSDVQDTTEPTLQSRCRSLDAQLIYEMLRQLEGSQSPPCCPQSDKVHNLCCGAYDTVRLEQSKLLLCGFDLPASPSHVSLHPDPTR